MGTSWLMGLDGQRRLARGRAPAVAVVVDVGAALVARFTPCLGDSMGRPAPAVPGDRAPDGGRMALPRERLDDARDHHRPAQKGDTDGSGRVAPRTGARGDPDSR